ncbi:BspA family leucine-rich repeat surface protein [Elizabethkingia ursingii]|uniref:BspA family leucine-rich repeat surface protein n=1 Tax=Elizabethkingia ursingii TaxID=1756150 RepID=UPI002013413E|nr:BspA family leucine-rich repeat surface protein [Elizabethkingia ursingii]MCL1666386.1 BspA family leucine-rich repeat surface protein [Elizabethkingia ursingii]
MNSLILKSPGTSLRALPLADHMCLRIFRTPETDQNKFLHIRFDGAGMVKIIGGRMYESLDDTVGKTEFYDNGAEYGMLIKINPNENDCYLCFPDDAPYKWRIRYGVGYLPYHVDDPTVPKADWTSNLYNLRSLTSMFQWLTVLKNQPIYGIKHTPDYGIGGSLHHTFDGCSEFNEPIESLDTRNYVDFTAAFNDCFKFNKPIGKLNVKSAKTFQEMFRRCFNLNRSIKDWGDLSWVDNFDAMFLECVSFDQDLSHIKFHKEAYFERIIMWSGMGPENYGKFLKNLDSLDFTGRTTPKVLNADGLFYDPKYKSSRDSLIGKGWSIMDAGVITYTIV